MSKEVRREIIKCYLGALYADGVFSGATSTLDLMKKAVAAFSEDAAIVVGSEGLKRVGAQLGGALQAKLSEVATAISERGLGETLGSLWGNVQQAYNRGVEVNARRKG